MRTLIKHPGGRPRLTEAQKIQRKEYLSEKLKPYLMSGLSVNKALRETKVANSEFYKFMSEDRLFGEKIAQFRQFIGVLANQAIVHELFAIVEKQNRNELLSKDDREFLWWYAINSNLCREEWGRRTSVSSYDFDPEIEIQKVKQIIEQSTAKEIQHIN